MSRTKRRNLLKAEQKLNKAGYRLIAGVDEAGRGPLAGPVVASAVILRDFNFANRIDDSKKLTSRVRERSYREIFKKALVGIGIVDEKIIDSINIYQATKRAMELAVKNLKSEPDHIIVDGNMPFRAKCPVKCIVQGDSKSLSIAAASIVAKVTRDRIMKEYDAIYPQYGFSRHKGYPTRSHREAIKRNGPSPIHRMTFHPLKDL